MKKASLLLSLCLLSLTLFSQVEKPNGIGKFTLYSSTKTLLNLVPKNEVQKIYTAAEFDAFKIDPPYLLCELTRDPSKNDSLFIKKRFLYYHLPNVRMFLLSKYEITSKLWVKNMLLVYQNDSLVFINISKLNQNFLDAFYTKYGTPSFQTTNDQEGSTTFGTWATDKNISCLSMQTTYKNKNQDKFDAYVIGIMDLSKILLMNKQEKLQLPTTHQNETPKSNKTSKKIE